MSSNCVYIDVNNTCVRLKNSSASEFWRGYYPAQLCMLIIKQILFIIIFLHLKTIRCFIAIVRNFKQNKYNYETIYQKTIIIPNWNHVLRSNDRTDELSHSDSRHRPY